MVVGDTLLANSCGGCTAPQLVPLQLEIKEADEGNGEEHLSWTVNNAACPLGLSVTASDDGDMSETSNDAWEEDDFMSLVSGSDQSSMVSSTDHSPTPTDQRNHDNSRQSNDFSGKHYIYRTPVITDLTTTSGQTCIDSDVISTTSSFDDYDVGLTDLDKTPSGKSGIPPHLHIVSAAVTGFTTEKNRGNNSNNGSKSAQGGSGSGGGGGGGGHPDIVFIVELKWSDGRVNVITRTYTDFCRLQYYLINEFVDVPANESPARLNIYLPVRRDVLPEDLMQMHAEPQDSILLAESRELLLNQYVQELVKMSHKISASPTCLTFFESRNSDPVPYSETVDTSRVGVTDSYVLCWI